MATSNTSTLSFTPVSVVVLAADGRVLRSGEVKRIETRDAHFNVGSSRWTRGERPYIADLQFTSRDDPSQGFLARGRVYGLQGHADGDLFMTGPIRNLQFRSGDPLPFRAGAIGSVRVETGAEALARLTVRNTAPDVLEL